MIEKSRQSHDSTYLETPILPQLQDMSRLVEFIMSGYLTYPDGQSFHILTGQLCTRNPSNDTGKYNPSIVTCSGLFCILPAAGATSSSVCAKCPAGSYANTTGLWRFYILLLHWFYSHGKWPSLWNKVSNFPCFPKPQNRHLFCW